MNVSTEKKVIKTSTSSGAGTLSLVMVSLAASLSGPASCYGFEEDVPCNQYSYFIKNIENNSYQTKSLDRLKTYADDNYNSKVQNSTEIENIHSDLKFLEVSQKFSESQIELDSEIQEALNNFSSISGSKKPKRDRF